MAENAADQQLIVGPEEADLCLEGYRLCQSSYHVGNRQLPADNNFFYRNKKRWDGWSSVCKVCWNKQKVDAKNRAAKQDEQNAVKAIVKLARNHHNVPHMTELVETIYNKLGGVEEFVSMFIDDILAANPGSPHRLRAQESIIHLTVKNTQEGHAQKPLELYTDDELAGYLEAQAMTASKATEQLKEYPDQIELLDSDYNEEADATEATEGDEYDSDEAGSSEGG